MTKIAKLSSVIVLACLCLVLTPAEIKAQSLALSIDPPLVETMIKPGKSIVIAYTIGNQGDPIVLTPSISTMRARGIEGAVQVDKTLSGPIRFNLENSSISLENSFVLKSKEKEQLLLKMRVPEGTPEGDYYYTFSVQSDPGVLFQDETRSKSQISIGANILITVTNSGNTQVQGAILKFATTPRWKFTVFGKELSIIDSSDSIPVDLIVHNTGQNYFKAKGTIELKGPLGEKSRYNLIPQNIIKDSSRILTATPSAQIDCDSNTSAPLCTSTHTLILSGLFIGPYSLRSTVVTSDAMPSLIGSTAFIGIPIKFFIAAISALGIFMVILKKVKQDEGTDSHS